MRAESSVGTLIYALTGETCPEVLRQISELPFKKVFERILNNDEDVILSEIMRRKSAI